MQKVTVLVPMKGHSERVPNKNMKPFHGRPLYHYIVETALSCPYVEKVAINTDGEALKADIQKHFPDVLIIDRPKEIQGDFVSMNKIIAYDLSVLEGEYFLQTHSTNPLLSTTTMSRAIEVYFENMDKHDSLFSVTRLQTRLYWGDGRPINHDPEELLRTQDLPPVYEENSNFYIFSKRSFQEAGNNRIGKKPLLFEVDKLEAIDIDEPQDFLLAETLYTVLRKDR